MRTQLAGLYVLILGLASGQAFGEPPHAILPGDGAINGAVIAPYDNAWSVIVRSRDGSIRHVGLATDHVGLVILNGHRLIQRIEGEVDDDGSPSEISMTWSDPTTLAPYADENRAADGSVTQRRFDGTRLVVRTIARPGAKQTVLQFDLSQPVFDFRGNMAGLILRAQPLAPGYAARIPWADTDGVVHLTEIHVLRREAVYAGLIGKIQTWVVAVGAAPSHTTYWIGDRSPYVIRCEVKSEDSVSVWQTIP